MKVKVTQSCPTLCDPMGCPWNSPGQNTGIGSLFLLQGIIPTQGLNPGLPHCRWILYQLSHKESPGILEQVAYPPPGDLHDPGIELGSPALPADSLPSELSGKPQYLLEVVLYSKLHDIRRHPASGCLTLVGMKLITSKAVTARLLCCKGVFHTVGPLSNLWGGFLFTQLCLYIAF